MNVFQLIGTDYRRYRAMGAQPLVIIFMTQGFWASTVYRLSYAGRRIRVPGLRHLAIVLGLLAGKWIEIVAGISLPATCQIGPGLYIGHFGPVIVSPSARLGSNCNLSQGVTIGLAGRGEKRGAPQIGDRAYIGTNAVVLGAITIGSDAALGAGAIVTKDVPPRGVAVGNPARVVSTGGSFDFVRYSGMDADDARRVSLAARDGLQNGETAVDEAAEALG